MSSSAVVVVDPQRAFVDERGTFARAFGLSEIAPLRSMLVRLADYLHTAGSHRPVIIIRSEYPPGARCPDPADPLSRLCAPDSTVDLPLAIRPLSHHHVVTKHGVDATAEAGFRDALDALPGWVDTVLVCGVTTTSCVRSAACGLMAGWAAERPGRRVIVAPLLTAARRTAYRTAGGEASRFHAALAEMRAAGVQLTLAPWGGVG